MGWGLCGLWALGVWPGHSTQRNLISERHLNSMRTIIAGNLNLPTFCDFSQLPCQADDSMTSDGPRLPPPIPLLSHFLLPLFILWPWEMSWVEMRWDEMRWDDLRWELSYFGIHQSMGKEVKQMQEMEEVKQKYDARGWLCEWPLKCHKKRKLMHWKHSNGKAVKAMARGEWRADRERERGSQGKSLTLMLDEARGLHSGD